MDKIELNIIALANSESQKGNFSLILEEAVGFRRLPIVIGPFEAQSIAIALENMSTKRPLTHDLIINIFDKTQVAIDHVVISRVEEDIFYSTMILKTGNGTIEIDCRTSDAIALAVRRHCVIYTTEEVMSQAGIILDSPSKAFSNKRGSLSEYTIEELKSILAQVIAKEDYESASKIRDAIAKKGSKEIDE